MFLSGSFLGVSPIFGIVNIIPPVVQYNNFKFYGGETGANFAKIWGRNIKLTEDLVNSYNLSTYNPIWDVNTYFLTTFRNSLNAGNIDGIVGEVEGWNLYRKEKSSTSLEFIGVLDTDNIIYFDFNALNNKTYQYYLFAKDSTSLAPPVLTNEVVADYYGWFLVDVENNRAYQFDIEFEGGDKNYSESITEHVTNNRVNAFTRGGNFYVNGTISAIISKNNLKQDAQYTNDDLKSLAEFVNSDRKKVLKSRRGEIWNVFTHGYKETLLNPSISENIYVSTFNFEEVGDI